MRIFRWLIVALFLLPWLSAEAAAPAARAEAASIGWRRTGDGWQQISVVRPPVEYPRPALHPAVVASLELLLTLTAMLALSAGSKKRRTAGDYIAIRCGDSATPRQ